MIDVDGLLFDKEKIFLKFIQADLKSFRKILLSLITKPEVIACNSGSDA